MPAGTDRLLEAYKRYENLVRDAGEDPRAVEDAMDEVSSNRMRMTRQFRNYLSHVHDPGFLEPTERMLAFLDARVAEWAMRGEVAGRHLKRPASAACVDADACAAVLERMAKLKTTRIVVVRDGAYYLLSLFDVARAVARDPGSSVAVVAKSRERPVLVAPDAPVSDLDLTRVHVCTSDGTAAGRFLGVVAP